MISSGADLYKRFKQYRSSKTPYSPPKIVFSMPTANKYHSEDIPWSSNFDYLELDLEPCRKRFKPHVDTIDRFSTWVQVKQEVCEDDNVSNHNSVADTVEGIGKQSVKFEPEEGIASLSQSEGLIRKEFEMVESAKEPEKLLSHLTGSSVPSIAEETMYHQFVNLVRVHELYLTYNKDIVYRPVIPLLNHLRRRVLGILRFCIEPNKGGDVKRLLKENWSSTHFLNKAINEAISDVQWASKSKFFKKCKVQIQLDLAAGPFATFEEIQAIKSIAKKYEIV